MHLAKSCFIGLYPVSGVCTSGSEEDVVTEPSKQAEKGSPGMYLALGRLKLPQLQQEHH